MNDILKHILRCLRAERASGILEPIKFKDGDNEKIARAATSWTKMYHNRQEVCKKTAKTCRAAMMIARSGNKTPIESLVTACGINEVHAYDIITELRNVFPEEDEEEEKEIFELIWINIDPEDEHYSFKQGVKAMDNVRKEMPGLSIEGLENFANFGYGTMEMFKITGKPDDVHYVEERYYELCRNISEAKYDEP